MLVSRSALHSIDIEEEQVRQTHVDAVRALAPVFFYFVAAGIATVMIGPLLPELSRHWQLRDAQAGTLFTADFLGQLCGSWFAARNLKASIAYGSAFTAAGCAALAWLNFGPAHIAFFAIGLGLGAGLTAGNVIAGTVLPASRTRLITMLNVAWGAGAIACPLLIRLTASGGVQLFLDIAAACLAVSTLLSLTIPNSAPLWTATEPSPQLFARVPRSTGVIKSGMPLPAFPLLVFIAAMLLYVGVENSLGGWLPSYAVRCDPTARASSVSILFWTAELIGRLLVAALVAVISEGALYRICLTVLISVEVLLCVMSHPSAHSVMALTVLTALTLAPVYPLILSFLLARTGNHARLGVLFASACCGGASLPWLTGVLSTQFHGLRAGLIVPATGAVLLLVLSSIITAKPRETAKVQ
jgi:FHS family glucose/mannose:H+ symporter-like MFS transporter